MAAMFDARRAARAVLPAVFAFLAGAGAARGTWSIILIDTRTKEIALGSATCLVGFDLQANTPVIITGVGGATAQSFVDSTGQNRVFIRDKLALGVAPSDILAGLAVFDPSHQTRQYGIADVLGRTATFSGTGASAWAGGQTGQFTNVYLGQSGDIAYAIQGNILTGPCVVDAAVQAAINTPGDLPAKLMASMQAARVAGGDGRCSCPANPTSCGCPPASFTKSAHIAYMLIARAGDTDGSFGIYRVPAGPWALAARDLSGDGLPELLSANTSSTSFSVLPNITPAGNPFAMFGPAVNYTVGSSPRAIGLADMNGDTLPDAVIANFAGNTLSILPGTAGGGFGPKTDYLSGGSPGSLALGDLDGVNGIDAAVSNQSVGLVSVMRNNGSGGLLPPEQYLVGVDPRTIVAARVNADAHLDLVVVVRGMNKLAVLLNNGSGTFTPGTDIPTPASPTFLAAGDFDGDLDTDLAVATQAAPVGVTVLLNDGAGSFSATSHALPITPNGIAAGDVTGEGNPDLVVPVAGNQFVVLAGSASGAFTVGPARYAGVGLNDGVLADLNADGDLDAAFVNISTSVIVADNYGGGVFPDGAGTASGDYFMTFNVANQQAGNPDPVATLQGMFNQWRQALSGRPDAVQSLVQVAPASLPANGSAQAVLTLTLRDWNGQGMTTPIQSVAVMHAPGSAGSSSIGPVTNLGGGVYSVMLTAGTTPGTDRLRIVVDDGVRPVTIMPDPVLTLSSTCYADCTGDGLLTIADFACFQTRFVQGDPYADCDGANGLTIADFACFQTKFVQGCP